MKAAALLLLPALAFAGLITQSGSRLFVSGGEEPGGDLVHGETATISGTGFGSVASPVLIYDDFSTGTLNDLVELTAASFTGTWERSSGGDDTRRSNAVSRGVHSRVSYHDLDNNTTAALSMNEAFNGDWYFDWWQRTDLAADNSNSNWTRSHKVFRFYLAQDTNDGNQLVYNFNGASPTASPGDREIHHTGTSSPPPGSVVDYASDEIPLTEWRHYKLRLRIPATYNNTDVMDLTVADAGSTRIELYSGTWRVGDVEVGGQDVYPGEFRLGDYWAQDDGGTGAGDNGGANIYTSSVYIANTWARVELCNNVSYAAATLCEIQPVSVRTDTGITYTVNKGLLSSGTVYEYVFNASNSQVQSTSRTLE